MTYLKPMQYRYSYKPKRNYRYHKCMICQKPMLCNPYTKYKFSRTVHLICSKIVRRAKEYKRKYNNPVAFGFKINREHNNGIGDKYHG